MLCFERTSERECFKDLLTDLALYGMYIENGYTTLLVKKSELDELNELVKNNMITKDHIDITLSSENGYTVLTVIYTQKRSFNFNYNKPYFDDTGFITREKYVMVLPEEKCRFVQKYGYENIKFSEIEKIDILYFLINHAMFDVFYSKPIPPEDLEELKKLDSSAEYLMDRNNLITIEIVEPNDDDD